MSNETVKSPSGDETNAIDRVVSDPVSRRKFLVLAGGSSAAAAFLAACGDDEEDTSTSAQTSDDTSDDMSTSDPPPEGGDPLAMFGEGDIGIANYALTLEYLEADFYDKVVKSGLFKGADLTLIKEIGQNEQEHVTALTQLIEQSGGKPAPIPKTKFPLDSAQSVLELAATVENLGASAYLGQAAAIKSKAVLAAALSIHTVEGRHAAALNVLTGQSPTPDGPFAKPADAATVLAAVKPFIVA